MTTRVIMALCSVLGACTPTPPPEVWAPEPNPVALRNDRVGLAVQRAMWLPNASGERGDEDAGGVMVVDVSLMNEQSLHFDGFQSVQRTLVLQRDQFFLETKEHSYVPQDNLSPLALPLKFFIRPGEEPNLTGRLAFSLPEKPRPGEATLRLNMLGRDDLVYALPNSEPPTHRILRVNDVYGNDMMSRGVTVMVGNQSADIAGMNSGWWVPVASETPVTVSHPQLEPLVLEPLAPTHGAKEITLIDERWVVSPDLEPTFTVAQLAKQLTHRDQAISFVKEQIGITPTVGIKQSGDSTLRRRAGSPHERAQLLRELLTELGETSRFACGDLTALQANALYDQNPSLPPLASEPLPSLARDLFASSSTELASSLQTQALLPSHFTQWQLNPEWCWVQVEEAPQEWVDIDIRPSPFDEEPLPFLWRTTQRLPKYLWRIELQLLGIFRVEGSEETQAQILTTQVTDAASLSKGAVVIDLFPDGLDLTGWRINYGRVTPSRFSTDFIKRIDKSALDRLVLSLNILDPSKVPVRKQEITLWTPKDDRPELTRITLAGNTYDLRGAYTESLATPERIARHPRPDALRQLHRAGQYFFTYNRLVEGQVSTHPELLVTTSTWSETHAEERIRTINPGQFAGTDAGAVADAVAKSATAQAIAQQWGLVGSDAQLALDSPEGFTSDITTLLSLRGIPEETRTEMRRYAEDGLSYDAVPEGFVWERATDPASLNAYPAGPITRDHEGTFPSPTTFTHSPMWLYDSWERAGSSR